MATNFRSILITGASSGIGAALAQHYAAKNVTLFLTGRNQPRLDVVKAACEKQGANVFTATADVTDKDAMDRLICAWDADIPIDLVIANAGLSQKGEESRESVEKIIAVNLGGVINTIYPLIPAMKQRGRGQIAVISSLAGFRGMPTAVSYSAAKNAVRALGDALRPTLKAYGIGVNVICPGFIKTPLTDVNPFPMPFLMSAEKAAKVIAGAIAKNKKRLLFPLPMAISAWLLASLPVWLTDPLITKMAQKKRKMPS